MMPIQWQGESILSMQLTPESVTQIASAISAQLSGAADRQALAGC
jgi:hypothetical protein